MNKNDLNKYFKRKKIIVTGHTGFKGSWLTLSLKNLGANHSGKKIKGKFTNTWSIPNFQMQTEEFKQPNINKEAYE